MRNIKDLQNNDFSATFIMPRLYTAKASFSNDIDRTPIIFIAQGWPDHTEHVSQRHAGCLCSTPMWINGMKMNHSPKQTQCLNSQLDNKPNRWMLLWETLQWTHNLTNSSNAT